MKNPKCAGKFIPCAYYICKKPVWILSMPFYLAFLPPCCSCSHRTSGLNLDLASSCFSVRNSEMDMGNFFCATNSLRPLSATGPGCTFNIRPNALQSLPAFRMCASSGAYRNSTRRTADSQPTRYGENTDPIPTGRFASGGRSSTSTMPGFWAT